MISVAILSKNNEKTIEKTLLSTMSFEEVILLDTGSSDQTLSIAKKFNNVKIHKIQFSSFSQLRNMAAKLASNEWILALDSDEVLSNDLINEIPSLSFSSNCVYSFPFLNYYNNKLIKWCGWYPEYHVRLYNKNKTNFTFAYVHESLKLDNINILQCKHPILHYSYHSIDDFLTKMQSYSSYFAKQYHNKKSSSFAKACFHGFFAFIKSYIIKRGIFGGKEGFIISIYNANTAFFKYLKLEEINKQKE